MEVKLSTKHQMVSCAFHPASLRVWVCTALINPIDGTEPIDDDPHSFLMITKGDVPIPFEPRLLHTLDVNGARVMKKEVVTIDLIVVKSGESISRAIQNFDIDICKCSWDGLGRISRENTQ